MHTWGKSNKYRGRDQIFILNYISHVGYLIMVKEEPDEFLLASFPDPAYMGHLSRQTGSLPEQDRPALQLQGKSGGCLGQ